MNKFKEQEIANAKNIPKTKTGKKLVRQKKFGQ